MKDVEILQKAIKLEKDGRKFFQQAYNKTSHPLAKETFKSLADWELQHITAIKKYHSILHDIGEWGTVAELSQDKGKAISKFRSLFEQARQRIDESVQTETDLIQAYKVAKDIENKVITFYKKSAAETSEPKAKQFYEFLLNQEREHFKILDNSLQYLENPSQWYIRDEDWMFDGG
ncbi:MAG: ferritin family protein [bacterium]